MFFVALRHPVLLCGYARCHRRVTRADDLLTEPLGSRSSDLMAKSVLLWPDSHSLGCTTVTQRLTVPHVLSGAPFTGSCSPQVGYGDTGLSDGEALDEEADLVGSGSPWGRVQAK